MAAVAYLRARNFKVLTQNYRIPEGEIDIVVQTPRSIRFIEVKTRTNYKFGEPNNSLTLTKKQRLITAALTFMAEMQDKKYPEIAPEEDWGVDLITVEMNQAGKVLAIEMYLNVVDAHDFPDNL